MDNSGRAIVRGKRTGAFSPMNLQVDEEMMKPVYNVLQLDSAKFQIDCMYYVATVG